MKKLITAIGIIFVLFLIVVVLAILNLNLFINSNKDFFLSQIENSVGRKVEVGEIKTGFEGGLGIKLENFSIEEDKSFSEGYFIRAAKAQINVEFIPLLSRKIIISKLILNTPVIEIIQNEDGQYNYQTIGYGKSEKIGEKSLKNQTNNEIPILASSIVIDNGRIDYIDNKNHIEFQIQQISLEASNLGLNEKIALNLNAAVLSSEPNILLAGTFGPLDSDLNLENMPAAGRLEIDNLNINNLKKFIPAIDKYLPKGLDISGGINTRIAFSGSVDSLMLSDMDINASVFGSNVPNLDITGEIGPVGKKIEKINFDTEFSLRDANLSKLRKFSLLKDFFPNSLSTQGTVDFSGNFKGDAQEFEFSSLKLDATSSRLAVIGKFYKPKNSPFTVTTDGKISKKAVDIKKANIALNALKLSSTGKINIGTTNLINLSVSSNRVNLTEISETFPSISKYRPSGQLQLLETIVKGELGKGQIPELYGSVVIQNAAVSPPSFPRAITDINTTINFTGKSAQVEDMTLNLGNSDINITANIDAFSPLTLSYDISSPELHLSDISKEKNSGSKAEILKELNSKGKISNKNDILTIGGSLSSKAANISSFELEDINTEFKLLNETVKIESLNAKAYDGLISAKAGYHLGSDSDFSLIANVKDFNLQKFLNSRDSDNADKIRGKANLDINIFGSGKRWEDIEDALKGTAKSEIIDGAVSDINIADDVLREITGVPGLTFLVSSSTKQKYPQVFTTSDTEFEEFEASFVIENGRMETRDLRIKSPDYLITGKGWMRLDGKINMKSLLILSKKFSQDLESDIPDAKFITNSDNQVEIPFSINGTLPDVRTKPDISYLAKSIQRAGIKSVIEELTSEPQGDRDTNVDVEPTPSPKKEKKRLDQKIFDELKDIF